jgi:hypothetical protein
MVVVTLAAMLIFWIDAFFVVDAHRNWKSSALAASPAAMIPVEPAQEKLPPV